MAMKRIIGEDGLPYLIDIPEEANTQLNAWASPSFQAVTEDFATPRLSNYPDMTNRHTDSDDDIKLLPDAPYSSQASTPVRGLLLRAMAANDDAGGYSAQSSDAEKENDVFSSEEGNRGSEDTPDGNMDSADLSPAYQGNATSEYSGRSADQQSQPVRTGLLGQFTDTLARREGNKFGAKGQQSRFRNPMEQIPGTDPSIPEVQNSDGSWTLPFGGNAHPITPYNGHQILKGRDRPVSYSNADIDEKNKIINVKVLMDYQKPSLFSRVTGLSKQVTDEQFEKYAKLANEGIARC